MGLAGGCSSTSTVESGERICTPGAYVFCTCANRDNGTKLCKEDGKSFEPCMLGEGLPCPGGEIPTDKDAGPGGDATVDTKSAERCPGKPVSVDGTAETIVQGDTTSASADDFPSSGACAVAETSADHVYELVPKDTGHLNIKLQGLGAYDSTLYVREDDCKTGRQAACGETTGQGGKEEVNTNVIAGNKYYVFVDGAAGSAGQYSLTLKLTPGSFCGDGTVDPGEACDDKNRIPQDGCSLGCRPEGNPMTANTCPGQPVHVWDQKVSFDGTTNGFGNGYAINTTATCVGATSSGAGADHVYEVHAHKTGTLAVTTVLPVASTYQTSLHARTTCDQQPTQIDCVNAQNSGIGETMSFAVVDKQIYYVFVDGAAGQSGDYNISFEIN